MENSRISKLLPLLWIFARVFVGSVFVYAGLTKLLEPAANFEAALLKYGVFSPALIFWMARIVPWVEWILGSFLVLGYAPRFTARASALLCLAFLVTLGSSRLFLEAGGTDCGCFGNLGLHLNVRQIFVVDLVNLALLLRIAFLKEFPGSVHSFLLK